MSSPIRVLHVLQSLNPANGGPVTALAGLASAQSQVGLQVAVASVAEPAAQTVAASLRAVAVEQTLLPPVRQLGTNGAALKRLNEAVRRADVIHIHGLWLSLPHLACVLARRRNVPYIIRPCGMLDPWSLSHKRLKKQFYMLWRQRRDLRHAAALHFTTREEAANAPRLGLPPILLVEPNGIFLRQLTEAHCRGSLRSQMGIGANGLLLIFVGRLHHVKGLDLLLQAVRLMRDNPGTPPVALALVGPDERGHRAQLQALTCKLGLQNQVLFTGPLFGDEVTEALADANLFVLPSYHENFGNAVIEALAAGTPAIVSDRVNLHHEIEMAGVGAVCQCDADSIAEVLSQWVQDTDLRLQAGARARSFVADRYDWLQIARRWQKHYRDIISGYPRTSAA